MEKNCHEKEEGLKTVVSLGVGALLEVALPDAFIVVAFQVALLAVASLVATRIPH